MREMTQEEKELMSVFAHRVKSARLGANLSQFKMAKAMDLGSVISISNWENEKSFCDMGTLAKIAKFFGRPASWFISSDSTDVDEATTNVRSKLTSNIPFSAWMGINVADLALAG
jgi:transcriptional regulator with XRE-family HTH domain